MGGGREGRGGREKERGKLMKYLDGLKHVAVALISVRAFHSLAQLSRFLIFLLSYCGVMMTPSSSSSSSSSPPRGEGGREGRGREERWGRGGYH